MTKLAVIGAGNLGSRHLQALAKLKRPSEIVVVDPDQMALERAAARCAEIGANAASVTYVRSIDKIGSDLDVAIVATNADIRADIVRKLLAQRRVRGLLLEKVLFTRPDDYADIAGVLQRHGVKAWVNCVRRAWPFYRQLQERLASSVLREVSVSGVEWGLGCNSIHMLDLMAWLCRSNSYTIDSVRLDDGARPAKRVGFVEFTGALSGAFRNGPIFQIASWSAGSARGMPFLLQVIADDAVYIVREDEGRAWIADGRSGWKWQEVPCQVVLQSDLTHHVVEEILAKGTAPLTTYDDSAALHAPMLEAFIQHLQARSPTAAIVECRVT